MATAYVKLDYKMPPDAIWSERFNKTEVKLNFTEIGWKDLMNECLMGAEIFKKEESEGQECFRLDPNLIMDMRHRMVKEHLKPILLPQTQLHSEALKQLRKATRDKLLREKQIKTIDKEVDKLRQTLHSQRLSTQKQLDEITKTKNTKSLKKICSEIEARKEEPENEGKNEILRRFLARNKTKTTRNWKACEKQQKNRNKIEAFLSKLKEKTQKSNERDDRLKKLMEEVKTSKAEACQKLAEISKHQVNPNPKFLEKMQERQEERQKRKKELEEKKRKLEEEREKAKRELEEEKKREEEDTKRRRMEEVKEKRRLEKERNLRELAWRQKLKAAENHYRLYLLKSYGLRPWLKLLEIRDARQELAVAHYYEGLARKVFRHWLADVQVRVGLKQKLADEFRNRLIKKTYLSNWFEFYTEKIKQNQVAVDWNEFRVTERAFKKWLEFKEDEQTLYFERTESARIYYERKLKFKYLKKLQNYPEYKRLERAKENRKRMWREKVREILPDYQPADVLEDF